MSSRQRSASSWIRSARRRIRGAENAGVSSLRIRVCSRCSVS
ncbi:hypothetical protein ABZ912_57855 [Nonomuraea angiospora]